MRLIRSIHSNRLPGDGCALTIGNFDAVHMGHQKILRRLVRQGAARSVPSVVMTFDPTPEEYFRQDGLSTRLGTVSSRYFLLDQCGIDCMLVLNFNHSLSETGAQSFIEEYLVNRLHIKYVLVGDDFRFGKARKGDFTMLTEAGRRFGYDVDQYQTVEYEGRRVSSTYIKRLLAEGNLEKARTLLGRHYGITGRVLHGDKRGRQWGFPTLNLAIKSKPAMTGVFAVAVRGLGEQPLYGVANLGKRPTIGGLKTLLEVHLFDFSGEVYGCRICVDFLWKIRDEKKFDSFDDLRNQILQDVETAKKGFAGQKYGV